MAHGHAVKRHTGLMDWLTTVDHKKIGILYLIAGGFFFLVGGLEALLIRIQLWKPLNDFVGADTYNELLTMHGTTMIFLAAMPMLFALMNAIVPLQIGARDVAFPFVNALGFWTFFFGAVLLNVSWFAGSAPEAGWTAYAPLAGTTYSPGHGMDYYVIGLQIAGIGTLIGGINFLVTIINMRAPGMTFMRMPMFTWASFITSALILFAFPALTVGLAALMFDRIFDANFFDPSGGGNSVLWEHIFWIFGHPEVYILILPAFGVISDVISTFSRKRLFGYSSMVFATILIGFLGFMVWAHHMFTTGLGPIANSLFSIATMLIAVPTGIKIFNWLFTMWGGSIKFTTANLFAVGFIPTFVMGGVTGVMLAAAPADFQYHDSYFVVAHFHYVIVGGLILGIFSGLHYWWPKMFGRMLNETIGKLTFWTFFIGFHMTFFVQHFLGLLGMPRRIWTYLDGLGFNEMNLISTIGAILMGFGTIFFLLNVTITAFKPKNAVNDPWEDGRTLEWTISSPPPEYNFQQTPLVRGYDAFWKEKMEGKKGMTPAEPIGSIHMPSPSILPFFMSLGLFITGFGLLYSDGTWGSVGGIDTGYIIGAAGLLVTFTCMILRSLYDDHGFHIEPEDQHDGGVKA
ncbi:cytochrome c oxidase subunit I [Paenibacillus radicis (ex Gao et al. 2016)]|uniref:Cytochrome c oxidase subunit 1 n=1 Tax=Paenibacillus radicis (ex Gao et al. 2016) TaxID=1737354 RepID=A0A917LWF7_9BACL|nr:cytochrome c oxidase subunit I [Paenibacillus radicis (ex Gao et al. 2016)]GGG62415.1 cytochrome c oxidase subunit 1 [Paenibacillus radicis (ex Gao et al. 2016)]